MSYSKLLNKSYDPSNNSVLYISNMIQCAKYLQNGAEQDLVDILYSGTRNDCLVFVFKRTPLTAELYKKWQSHEL